MNGGTSRGGLYGYRLDALLKLATIKSVDQKRNLMNYLADWYANILALFSWNATPFLHVPLYMSKAN